jgi:hypothetical protein
MKGKVSVECDARGVDMGVMKGDSKSSSCDGKLSDHGEFMSGLSLGFGTKPRPAISSTTLSLECSLVEALAGEGLLAAFRLLGDL